MSRFLVPTRWRLFSLLFLLSFLSYLMRQNIHVAGEFMMPELGISEIEMGWIYAAFIWGYAVCQLPGGVFGKLLGPRLALSCAGVVWVITTGLTGWLPGEVFVTGAGVVGCLVVVRFLVGVAHAPIYPIQAAVVERWFPVGHWALPNAVGSTGLTLGAALAQPLVAFVMVYWGWRASFYIFIPLGMALFWLWWRYATDDPADHASMTQAELADIQANREQLTPDAGFGAWRQLIRNRDTLLLTCAYFAENCIFYLVFHLVLSLPGHRARLQYPRDRLSRLPSLAVRRGNGVGWRFYLRYPVCSSRTTPWMPHSRDHRAHCCRGISLHRPLRRLPLHGGRAALTLFCQHAVH